MLFLESTNFTLMAPKENDLEELPGKEFKRIIRTMFKQLKDDMPSLQEYENELNDEVYPIYENRTQ